MNAKEIIRKAGYKIAKGIGREWEFFVSDGKLISVILEKAFEEEREFIATGGEPLREYQLQNSAWK